MSKIVLNDTAGGYNLQNINDNFQRIEDEFNNKVLYRDNPEGEVNSLESDVDVNGKVLYNLPAPTLQSQAARLQDVQDAISGLPSASLIPFAPAGSISSTTVQGAIEEVSADVDALAGTNGAGSIGFSHALTYPLGSVGYAIDSVINVKNAPYNARGDGVTNDTAALIAAASDLLNGQSLYFPAGNYIVDTGCILFRGKTNISIFGDGKATRVHPSGQGVSGVKVDFHTTLAIDQCSFVTIKDMVIESKGESYGNADAYGGLPGGDQRADAVINFGGSALLVSRSDHVTLQSLDTRRCGSVGVVYLSSCEDITVVDCFANAMSQGYAGFAIDNWVESTAKPNRTYRFFNPRVSKEGATYSGKAGIASEGDQTVGRLINLEVHGGSFEDCGSGGDVLYLGSGISAFETRLTVNGLNTKNCFYGITWQKRGGAVDKSWCRIDGGSFDSCLVAGAYIAIGTATGGADVVFNGTRIDVQPVSHWSAQPNAAVNVSSGITVPGFSNGEIQLQAVKISGGQYGIWAIDKADYNIVASDISGSLAGIRTYGGGTLKMTGGRAAVTAGDRAIGRSTANFAASVSGDLFTYVNSALLECVADTAADFALILEGDSSKFIKTQITNNAVPMGVINASKGSATLYDVDIPSAWTPVVKGGTVAGTYELNAGTRCTYTKMGKLVTVNAYIVLAAAVTGGGTGDLVITGLPFQKRVDSAAFGTGAFSGVDFAAGAQLSCYFGTTGAASSLLFWQSTDNAGVTLLPISGVGASDIIAFSMTYEAA